MKTVMVLAAGSTRLNVQPVLQNVLDPATDGQPLSLAVCIFTYLNQVRMNTHVVGRSDVMHVCTYAAVLDGRGGRTSECRQATSPAVVPREAHGSLGRSHTSMDRKVLTYLYFVAISRKYQENSDLSTYSYTSSHHSDWKSTDRHGDQ